MFMRYTHNPTERVVIPRAPAATLLLRVAIAFIFVTEGVQKFLYPEVLGVGRFAKIGIPYPDFVAPFVGGIEVACGALILVGMVTRLAAFALFLDMIVAIAATKVPILLGYGYWMFADPTGNTGFWSMAHEVRTDIAMLAGCALLVAVGPGALSLDHRMMRRSP
jgi:putative oxidoreductase